MPKRTGLYQHHLDLGARMVDFGGWLLPVQYPAGPKAEHQAVREAAGLFDIDHMGQIEIAGPEARAFLQFVLSANIEHLEPGGAQYALLCYADGGIVDDTFVYCLDDDRFLLAVNAANRRKDYLWLTHHQTSYNLLLEDVSDETYMLAIQGPAAETILNPLSSADLSTMTFHTCLEGSVCDTPMLIARTGYTGEDGFELYFPTDQAAAIWEALLKTGAPSGLMPAGLAARDSLRLEACMPLYGHEISATTNPISAGLGWAADLDKSFVGRDAILQVRLEKPATVLVGFEMLDRGIPRSGYDLEIENAIQGYVTSGGYAPTLERSVGLGYLPRAYRHPGTSLNVVIRGKRHAARVVARPFYVPSYRRS